MAQTVLKVTKQTPLKHRRIWSTAALLKEAVPPARHIEISLTLFVSNLHFSLSHIFTSTS